MSARAGVPGCEDCTAFEENPVEFAEREVCPACPWGRDVEDARIFRLLHYLELLDAGCPVGRHELFDSEWKAIGVLKAEREKIASEKGQRENDNGATGR